MSAESAVSQQKTAPNLFRTLTRWLEPRSQDRDEAFRERSLRIAVTLITSLILLSLFFSVFLFRNEWSLISYPTLHIVVLVGFITSAHLISRQRIVSAAWI